MAQTPQKRRSSLDIFLMRMLKASGSDLHIKVGARVSYRRHGQVVPVEGQEDGRPVTKRIAEGLVKHIFETTFEPELLEIKRKEFALKRDIDVAYVLRDDKGEPYSRFRTNIHYERGNYGIVMRVIPTNIPTMGELSLPDSIRQFTTLPKGIVLVTGPTGSGKSTTLASMINEINGQRRDHIITLEDPIEFEHKSRRSIVTQREVGHDTPDFASGLKYALRQDPDVILVGEMRDPETARTALQAAETGHLVFATLHTSSAQTTVSRLVSMFPGSEQAHIRSMLAASLQGVVCQTLLPRNRGGRIVATEVMVMNTAARANIREAKDEMIDTNIQTHADLGSHSLDSSLIRLVQTNEITADAALGATMNPRDLELRIGGGTGKYEKMAAAQGVFGKNANEEDTED